MQPCKAILWALHVQGPDDVYAAPSWAEAAEAACYLEHRMTEARLRNEPNLQAISFVVTPWPHSAESHADEVRRWAEVYPGLPASAMCGVPVWDEHCCKLPAGHTGAHNADY